MSKFANKLFFCRIPCSTRDGITWVRQGLLRLGVKNNADPQLKTFTSSAIRKAYAQFANEADEPESHAQEAIRKDAAMHMGHANETADKHYRVDVSTTIVLLCMVVLLFLLSEFEQLSNCC